MSGPTVRVTVSVSTAWGDSTVERSSTKPLVLRQAEPIMVEAFEGALRSLGFQSDVEPEEKPTPKDSAEHVAAIKAQALREAAETFFPARGGFLAPRSYTPEHVYASLKLRATEIERGERS